MRWAPFFKALAALQGVTLKEYLLKSALDAREEGEEKALAELEAFLQARIRRTETVGFSTRSVDEIFDSVCAEKGISPQNG
ncbi:MAG: antitoxin [Verrucomicrobia bacterium]|nr:antitoxin [Verrucomicrobiota bacterium]